MKLRPIVKIHGGKHYLSDWIIHNFPQDYQEMTYVEPYCGAASVLLNKPRSKTEIINDVDPGMVAILKTTRDHPDEFIKRLQDIQYEREIFESAYNTARCSSATHYEMDHAVNEFVLRRMSRGGLKKSFGWSDRQRGGQPGDVNAWKTIIDMLPQISDRLQDVEIRNYSAMEFLWLVNKPDTFVYCDPPYLPKTRQSKQAYQYEMTEKDHKNLALALSSSHGKAMISGNPSALYEELYQEWSREEHVIANHSSQQKVKQYRIEVLWYNYAN